MPILDFNGWASPTPHDHLDQASYRISRILGGCSTTHDFCPGSTSNLDSSLFSYLIRIEVVAFIKEGITGQAVYYSPIALSKRGLYLFLNLGDPRISQTD